MVSLELKDGTDAYVALFPLTSSDALLTEHMLNPFNDVKSCCCHKFAKVDDGMGMQQRARMIVCVEVKLLSSKKIGDARRSD